MAKKPASKPSSSKAGRAANAKAAPSQDMPAAASVAALPASRGFVRVYRQGLGDCILVRLKREGQADFKLLIDCGVVLGTPEPTKPMKRVVGDIVKVTESAVDILAITHEHWDHLSGFIQAKDDFKPLKAGEVWVAWTEDEKDPLAKKLKSELGNAEKALAASAKALRGMGQGDAADLLHDLAATTFGMGAAGGASTKDAFDIAKKMAGAKPPRYCLPNDAPFEIPGLNARIYVLGPPHDEKLIRKINPTKSAPETYALALDGGGAMPVGLVAALGLQEKPDNGPLAHKSDSMPLNLGKLSWSDDGAPFHKRVSLPLDIGKTIRTTGAASTAIGSGRPPNSHSLCRAIPTTRAWCWQSSSAIPARAMSCSSPPTHKSAIGSPGKRSNGLAPILRSPVPVSSAARSSTRSAITAATTRP
jgi:hypothetical protein